jgi:hypothetical protein
MPVNSRQTLHESPADVKPESRSWLADLEPAVKPADPEFERMAEKYRRPDLPPPSGLLEHEWLKMCSMIDALGLDHTTRNSVLAIASISLTEIFESRPNSGWFRTMRVERGGRRTSRPRRRKVTATATTVTTSGGSAA